MGLTVGQAKQLFAQVDTDNTGSVTLQAANEPCMSRGVEQWARESR